MDWDRLSAAIIRGFWTFVFPMLGSLVAWLANDKNLQSIGVDDVTLAAGIAGVLYFIKKLWFPNTKF